MSTTVKQRDTHTLIFTIRDANGDPVDLTSATVRLLARPAGDPNADVIELATTIPDPTLGELRHVLTGTLTPDTYDVEAETTVGSTIATAPSIGYWTLIVESDLEGAPLPP